MAAAEQWRLWRPPNLRADFSTDGSVSRPEASAAQRGGRAAAARPGPPGTSRLCRNSFVGHDVSTAVRRISRSPAIVCRAAGRVEKRWLRLVASPLRGQRAANAADPTVRDFGARRSGPASCSISCSTHASTSGKSDWEFEQLEKPFIPSPGFEAAEGAGPRPSAKLRARGVHPGHLPGACRCSGSFGFAHCTIPDQAAAGGGSRGPQCRHWGDHGRCPPDRIDQDPLAQRRQNTGQPRRPGARTRP